jgi:hypothetical protein
MINTRVLVRWRKSPGIVLHTTKKMLVENEGIAFGLAIVLALAVRAVVLLRGFFSVSVDEFSRVLLGANWAESPYFIERYILGAWNCWQPWHFYLLGLALKVYDGDLFLTSRIVTMLFSLISLGMLYLLARKLFNRWVALFSVLIVGVMRAHVNLSLTPMVDVIFVTFLASFLYFFLVWLDSRADRYLLVAALMLSVASGLRYDGWFSAAIFGAYVGLRWLIELWATRSLHPLWPLAIGLAGLLICIWLLANYVYFGAPLHFLEGHKGSGPSLEIGPLTDLSIKLAYLELLLQNGGGILLLAVVGVALSYRSLAHRLWLYLAFGFAPFAILMLRNIVWGKLPGTAYRPHYPFPYIVLMTPFCAYAIYIVVTASRQSRHRPRWTAGWKMLVVMSAYNLWVAYLGFTQQQSWVLIGLLALAGGALSYLLLDTRHWLYWTLSLGPLPVLTFLSKSDLASGHLGLYAGLYITFLVLFYAYHIWRSVGVLSPPSHRRWRLAGWGILVILCMFNLWDTLLRIPEGMPRSAIQAGRAVRRLFDEGTLSGDDRVLVEVERRNYKGMQVMSNHPRNFILDRSAYGDSDIESFLLDEGSSPYEVGTFFTIYEEQVNPFSLDPPSSLDEYLNDKHIRLAIVKDPRLEGLLTEQTGFEKAGQVGEYFFYAAPSAQLDLATE